MHYIVAHLWERLGSGLWPAFVVSFIYSGGTMHWKSAALICSALAISVYAQSEARKSNMELVGYNDLQGRSAYQPVIEKQGSRWIAYIGHHAGVQPNALTGRDESNGTSVVDVTDPKHPK